MLPLLCKVLQKAVVHFTLTYRHQKSRTETKNSTQVWCQVCAGVQLSQHYLCSLWLTSTPAAALQVSSWHAAALDVFLLCFTTELFFSSECVRVSPSRTGMSAPERGTPPSSQGLKVPTLSGRIIKILLRCLGASRTNKGQQESPNQGENNILSLLAHRPELDNILLFFLSIFHHSSSIIEERETKGQGNG